MNSNSTFQTQSSVSLVTTTFVFQSENHVPTLLKPRFPSEFLCPLVGGMDIFCNSTLSGNDIEWKGKLDK